MGAHCMSTSGTMQLSAESHGASVGTARDGDLQLTAASARHSSTADLHDQMQCPGGHRYHSLVESEMCRRACLPV